MENDKTKLILQNKFLQQSLTDVGKAFAKERKAKQELEEIMERYRNKDRQEEANRIPLTESQKKQEELEPITKGVCVTGALKKDRDEQILITQENKELKEDQGIKQDLEHRKVWQQVWKARYEKEYKLRQEATELFNACHEKATKLEEELKKLKKKIDPKHITQKARESGL